MRRRALRVLVAAAATAASAARTHALERLEPPEGSYFGVNLNDGDTLPELASRLGITPAVSVGFFDFPFTAAAAGRLDGLLAQVREAGGIALLTLEPFQGLEAVGEAECRGLADLCAAEEARGIGGIMIRFAHEMNGNWYPWCQKPALYKEKFRLLAAEVLPRTGRTALLWAPSYGGGYPFAPSGRYRALPGTTDFALLDTDHDGVLSERDDMYEPFYPGDDAVNWVGMTIYHWGVRYPWLENELPEPRSFAAMLTGTYNGGNGDQTAVPDFYARYSGGSPRRKPLAIPETAAFFNTQEPGPGEMEIKAAWWRQVFNVSGDRADAVDVAARFPQMKMVNWFDHLKRESEAGGRWIDWRISAWEPLRSAFVSELRAPRNGRPWFLTGEDLGCLDSRECIVDGGVPGTVPLEGSVTVRVIARAEGRRDLAVDLLDEDFRWLGGTRGPVGAGEAPITLSFPLVERLREGVLYRWSIFLTPPGGDHRSALAWYRGPRPTARALAPSILLLGCPQIALPASTFEARVKCSAPGPAFVVSSVLDPSQNRLAGGAVPVGRGVRILDIPISLPEGAASGEYRIECSLSSTQDGLEVLARSREAAVLVAPRVEGDRIDAVPEPPWIPAGEVFRFTVSYAVASGRDLHLDLLTAERGRVASAAQPVGQGAGVRDLVLSAPEAPPGDYLVVAFITPPGLPRTSALAFSPERRLRVLERGADPGPEFPGARFLRGDVDGNGRVEITDAIAGLSHLFRGGQAMRCEAAADANDDGEIDVSDAVATLVFLFTGGRAPPDPGPFRCGTDPTPDALGCAEGCP